MSRFNKLKAAQAADTAEYEVFQIRVNDATPTLIVKQAGESNPPYFNALLKASARTARRALAGNIDAGTIAKNRAEDRKLFPKFVVQGWKDVVDDNGKAVPFTTEDCVDFLESIPDWVFDDLRNFCSTPANFMDITDITTEDVEAKGKN